MINPVLINPVNLVQAILINCWLYFKETSWELLRIKSRFMYIPGMLELGDIFLQLWPFDNLFGLIEPPWCMCDFSKTTGWISRKLHGNF